MSEIYFNFVSKKPRGNNLEGWDGEGGQRDVQVGGDMGKPMAVSTGFWQKPLQYYKVIILQLKINKFF